MAARATEISQMILDQLRLGERRVLSLTVAIRGLLSGSDGSKGDLSASVKSALRRLVVSGAVVDVDGMYSLARPGAVAAAVSSSAR